jgi:isoamylase
LYGRSVLVLSQYTEPVDEPDFSVAASLVALADPVAATSSPTRNKR